MVVFPFVTLLIAMMEIGFIFLIGSALDNGLESSMRQFYVQADASTRSRTEAIRAELCRRMELLAKCEAIKVDVAAYADFQSIDTSSPMDEATRTWRANFGTDHGCIAKGSIVVVQAGIAQKTFQNLGTTKGTFGDGSRLISASAVIQLDGNAASSAGC